MTNTPGTFGFENSGGNYRAVPSDVAGEFTIYEQRREHFGTDGGFPITTFKVDVTDEPAQSGRKRHRGLLTAARNALKAIPAPDFSIGETVRFNGGNAVYLGFGDSTSECRIEIPHLNRLFAETGTTTILNVDQRRVRALEPVFHDGR